MTRRMQGQRRRFRSCSLVTLFVDNVFDDVFGAVTVIQMLMYEPDSLDSLYEYLVQSRESLEDLVSSSSRKRAIVFLKPCPHDACV